MPDTGQDSDILNPHIGSQLPRTGNHFAGIYTFNRPIPGGIPDVVGYREYLEVELTTPLVPGKYYCAEMYVSLAEGPRYASNNLGMYFHTDPIHLIPYLININAVPQVVETEIIRDEQNWVRVSGAFRATTAARYLTIGNFSDNDHTQVVDKGGTKPLMYGYNYAYYFIDDVSVMQVQPEKVQFAGATTICQDDRTAITISNSLDNIEWTTMEDTLTVVNSGKQLIQKPTQTTRYRVRGKVCGLHVADTITVHVKPSPVVDLGKDIIACKGAGVRLDAGPDGTLYSWQDGQQGRYHEVKVNGVYNVSVTNSYGCKRSDAIAVKFKTPPRVDLGRDSLVCNAPYTLRAGNQGDWYEWSSGGADSILTPAKGGTYWVKVSNQCGSSIDTVRINVFNEIAVPNVVTLNGDGLNDLWVIQASPSQVGVKIMNRWGESVFVSDRYENDWPQKPESVPTGTYYYTVTSAGCVAKKDWLHVLR